MRGTAGACGSATERPRKGGDSGRPRDYPADIRRSTRIAIIPKRARFMKRLYLVRHGIAVPHGDPGFADDERPLTEQGEAHVRQVAKGLRRLKVKVDRIVTSPLPRAARTAQIIAEVLGLIDVLDADETLRADRDAPSIREWLTSRPEDRLMIVGHNPSLSDLAGLLLTGAHPLPTIELRKGGVAAFASGPDGGLRLDWIARPRLLRT